MEAIHADLGGSQARGRRHGRRAQALSAALASLDSLPRTRGLLRLRLGRARRTSAASAKGVVLNISPWNARKPRARSARRDPRRGRQAPSSSRGGARPASEALLARLAPAVAESASAVRGVSGSRGRHDRLLADAAANAKSPHGERLGRPPRMAAAARQGAGDARARRQVGRGVAKSANISLAAKRIAAGANGSPMPAPRMHLARLRALRRGGGGAGLAALANELKATVAERARVARGVERAGRGRGALRHRSHHRRARHRRARARRCSTAAAARRRRRRRVADRGGGALREADAASRPGARVRAAQAGDLRADPPRRRRAVGRRRRSQSVRERARRRAALYVDRGRGGRGARADGEAVGRRVGEGHGARARGGARPFGGVGASATPPAARLRRRAARSAERRQRRRCPSAFGRSPSPRAAACRRSSRRAHAKAGGVDAERGPLRRSSRPPRAVAPPPPSPARRRPTASALNGRRSYLSVKAPSRSAGLLAAASTGDTAPRGPPRASTVRRSRLCQALGPRGAPPVPEPTQDLTATPARRRRP